MMHPRTANIVSVTVTALLVTAVVCLDPIQCRRIWGSCSAQEPLLSIMAVPIQTCARECQARTACGAVNYWRHRRVCEMLYTDGGVMLQESTDQTCVFMEKSEICSLQAVLSVNFSSCATCGNHTVCDVSTSSCVVKECRQLHVDNAVVHGNRLDVGAVVRIVCTGGYTLEPPWPYSVCQNDGVWNNTPACLVNRTCLAPPTVHYATVAKGDTIIGSVSNYTCDPGFVLNGTSASVTCGQDATWTAVEFQCLKACSAPPTVAYATVATGDSTLGSVRNYTCDPGFVLNDTSASVTCGQDAMWTAVAFQCLNGLTDEVTEGAWLWMETGVALTFSNWAPNNPNGNDGDNYVKLRSDGLWVDKPVYSAYEVVCEKSPGP